ncbi:MAG: hypothetical protein KJ000_22265 [Pirellulaceae bacterium]|nr:hypothetical protein [Pirellulaceae bacterium]
MDMLILAEGDGIPAARFLATINSRGDSNLRFHNVVGQQKIRIYSRFPERAVAPVFDSGGISIRHVCAPGCRDFIMVAAHLPSKLRWQPGEQQDLCCRLRDFIEYAETQCGHQRTIVVGDLNMNPFEHGMVSSEGLHGVMARHDVKRKKRVVHGFDRYLFYNPMWAHFGERPNGPPGTYYSARSTPLSYYWNIFDQVLVRPDLLDSFPDDHLRILTKAGDMHLVGPTGRPDKTRVSDHLPILFQLRLML